ncbi:L-cysteate sulfo-lyase [Bradyrhizobium sp. USDA 3397]
MQATQGFAIGHDRLEGFPRVALSNLPTPFEALPRLTRYIGKTPLLVKRDDLTGLAFGGNKVRKLEYELGRWAGGNYDTLVTLGAVQSNHARQTAAAAAKLGMGCTLILENRLLESPWNYSHSGNVLLDRLFGADIAFIESGEAERSIEDVLIKLREAGKRPVFVSTGASTAFGALGYVRCAFELAAQAQAQQVRLRHVFHATGSGGTQAGLIAGFKLVGLPVKVWGICHGHPSDKRAVVHGILRELEILLDVNFGTSMSEITTLGDYMGAGYGIPSEAMYEALELVARFEGLALDPVYTGKAMAGLIDLTRNGTIPKDEVAALVHTGGTPALFAYSDAISARVSTHRDSNNGLERWLDSPSTSLDDPGRQVGRARRHM